MMYPVAVEGQMPFVDHKSYRDQQIKKVIQKHRAKRQRECLAEQYNMEKNRDSKATPVIHAALCRVSNHPRLSPIECDNKQEDNILDKRNILHAIKRFFSANSKSSKLSERSPQKSSSYQPRFVRNRPQSAPVNIAQPRKTALNSNSPPGVSPKRQRRRTVSNIGSIMETIDEIPENLTIAHNVDSDSSSSCASQSSCSLASSSLDDLLCEVSGHMSFRNSSPSLAELDSPKKSEPSSSNISILSCSA